MNETGFEMDEWVSLRCEALAKKAGEQFECDKVILWPEILGFLSRVDIDDTFLFEIRTGDKRAFCGVKQFSGKESVCQVPEYLYEKLGLEEDQLLTLSRVKLPKCTHMVVRTSQVFLGLEDPRGMLEQALSRHVVLEQGQTIDCFGFPVTIDVLEPDDVVQLVDVEVNLEIVAQPDEYNLSDGLAVEDLEREKETDQEKRAEETQAYTPGHAVFAQEKKEEGKVLGGSSQVPWYKRLK